jgi:hypothetical protein
VTKDEVEEVMRALSESTRAELAGKYSATLIQSRMELPSESLKKAVESFVYVSAGSVRDALVMVFGEDGAREYLSDAAAVIGPSKGERN